eukprot:g47723.t1
MSTKPASQREGEKVKDIGLASLASRVSRLERALGSPSAGIPEYSPEEIARLQRRSDVGGKGDDSTTALIQASLRDKTASEQLTLLTQALQEKEIKDLPSITEKYSSLRKLLDNEADVDALLLDAEMRENLVVAAAPSIESTATQLETLAALSNYLDNPPVTDLASLVKRLDVLETKCKADELSRQEFHQELTEFTAAYNHA